MLKVIQSKASQIFVTRTAYFDKGQLHCSLSADMTVYHPILLLLFEYKKYNISGSFLQCQLSIDNYHVSFCCFRDKKCVKMSSLFTLLRFFDELFSVITFWRCKKLLLFNAKWKKSPGRLFKHKMIFTTKFNRNFSAKVVNDLVRVSAVTWIEFLRGFFWQESIQKKISVMN